jgi:hypothetical protein
MTDLSPAAEAVLNAFGKYPLHGDHIAKTLMHGALPAALRAAADQVAKMRPHGGRAWSTEQAIAYDALTKATDHFLAIAAELEGGND